MKKELRKQAILKRKNFLPSLIFTIILWVALGAVAYFVDPSTFGAIYLFFLLVFFSLLFTFSLLLGSTRKGLILSISLTIFLILRYFGVGNILNLVLILALGVTAELYFARK
jgi:hypothetical protein